MEAKTIYMIDCKRKTMLVQQSYPYKRPLASQSELKMDTNKYPRAQHFQIAVGPECCSLGPSLNSTF